jgi:hypothetical protein
MEIWEPPTLISGKKYVYTYLELCEFHIFVFLIQKFNLYT